MSGVPVTVPSLPVVTPTAGDSIPLWDTESGIQGRATVTGMGAVFALLAANNTFAASQTIQATTASSVLFLSARDNGASIGPGLSIARNTNASTPAPGWVEMLTKSGQARNLFFDTSGLLKTHTILPTTDDSVGVVVGSQASHLETKDLVPGLSSVEDVLGFIAQGAAAVRRFRYKASTGFDSEGNPIEGTRPYGGEIFEGVVLGMEDAPTQRYGMDRDEEHPEGKSLNSINATGDLLVAVNWLVQQNAALVARVAALEGA